MPIRPENRTVQPPAPETLPRRQAPDTGLYAEAIAKATEIVPWKDHRGVTYCWELPPSRNTWPTWHTNRPAPTPGCACAECRRPRCCDTWAEPVELVVTGERVAWICPTCLEPVRCPDCEWVEVRTFASLQPEYVLGRPCKEHQ